MSLYDGGKKMNYKIEEIKKFKTSEEYILNRLYETENIVNDLLEQRAELEKRLEEALSDSTNETNMECIYLSDKPYYFYYVTVASAYNWNKILKSNKKKPIFVEQALVDEKKLKKLFDLVCKEGSWYYNEKISEIDERIYNYLFKDRRGHYAAVVLNRGDDISFYQIRDNVFLDKESAEEYRKAKVIKEAQSYLKEYKDKYEEEK